MRQRKVTVCGLPVFVLDLTVPPATPILDSELLFVAPDLPLAALVVSDESPLVWVPNQAHFMSDGGIRM